LTSKTIAILQARMGSSRLPGKSLQDLAGRPLLAHVIARARAIDGIDRVVVATTTDPRDEAIEALAQAEGVAAFRGSEDDVLDRFYGAAKTHGGDVIMRLTADCPVLDPRVSGMVLKRFMQGDVDYAGIGSPPTYPDGLDTEVFSIVALERAWREATLPSEREHVTPYIWKHPDEFRLVNLTHDPDLSAHRWTVDTAEDLAFVRAVYGHLYDPNAAPFGMDAVLALLAREPRLRDMNRGIERNEGYAISLNKDNRT
jgi:spore coat polysaccharide biosynthesis protein SpsF